MILEVGQIIKSRRFVILRIRTHCKDDLFAITAGSGIVRRHCSDCCLLYEVTFDVLSTLSDFIHITFMLS